MEPDDCHPDRIVECTLVPDKRELFVFHSEDVDGIREFVLNEDDVAANKALPVDNNMRLFLKRRHLAEAYNSESTRYQCSDCGKVFLSVVGAKYHCKVQSCIKQATDRRNEMVHLLADIDARAERLIMQQDKPPEPTASTAAVPDKQFSQGNIRPKIAQGKPMHSKNMRKAELDAVYPQVWHSLGFKIVPNISRTAPRVSYFESSKKKKQKVSYTNKRDTLYLNDVNDASMLDSGISKLKDELDKLRSERLGAMYTSTYKSLKFRKPSSKPPEPEPEPMPDPKAESEQEPPGPPAYVPLPPPSQFQPTIIDVRVLAGEVDSGRYPSMKRNSNDVETQQEHCDACYICKSKEGVLYLCDFCNKVNHLECLRTRFIVRDPEPHDDFMCNKCIQYLLAMRRRAERRRLRREGKTESAPGTADIVRQPHHQPSNTVDPAKDFDFLAQQAQNVEDIMHLLRDSQERLRQLAETARINESRRSKCDSDEKIHGL